MCWLNKDARRHLGFLCGAVNLTNWNSPESIYFLGVIPSLEEQKLVIGLVAQLSWKQFYTIKKHTDTHCLSHTQLCCIKYFNINQKEFFVFWNASLSSMNFLFLLIKFYWETVMPTHLPMVCNCFHSTIAELIGCNKDNIAHKTKNIYCMVLSRKFCSPLE